MSELSEIRSPVLKAVGITVLASVALDAFGLWPYRWNRPESPEGTYLASLLTGGQGGAVLFLGIRTVVLVPVLEEIVFRFYVLRLLLSQTRSLMLAIVVSSAVFAALHLGGGDDPRRLLNAAWLFGASIILGPLVVRADGRLAVVVAAHATRNGLEFILLLLYTRTVLGGATGMM